MHPGPLVTKADSGTRDLNNPVEPSGRVQSLRNGRLKDNRGSRNEGAGSMETEKYLGKEEISPIWSRDNFILRYAFLS